MSQTLFEKLWQRHLVSELDGDTGLLYIDRVFLHERTGSIALKSLESDGRQVKRPDQVFCAMDHIVDTLPGRNDETLVPSGKNFIQTTRQAAHAAEIQLFDIDDPRQGIVHVVSPEQGIVQPGLTLVCPDSHTCSQGALGALAWGIGSSEAEHALATKTLRVNKPKTMRVRFDGKLADGVTAKDMILHLIGSYGAAGGSGYVIEFAGAVITELDIEARLTLCNMAVEFSAFTGLIAPDSKTFAYLQGRPYVPAGEAWGQAVADWQTLYSDEQAEFDREIVVDCTEIAPTVTWGTSPEHALAITASVPDPGGEADVHRSQAMTKALTYMGLKPGDKLTELAITGAFIGSCTNSRISDLRVAANILKGRQVAEGVTAICVPGSSLVKRQAEAEGLDSVFKAAGFEWRESGCSMCFFAGGESFGYRERVVTSTNRNFESRQGPETRSHLASPATVAASAVLGRLADVRELEKRI
ncbi:3-isopropylmalate dehydratase large subunit [Aestuariicella hydrocarbonica]|uniref:3-isopropylmalate dehydratase n=1 Tax=Pseudomaricurvus hydrocarbonicus TaxID=1470433 RepID=A0A9E5MN13_9GAMM|nr:3-isopropylmalate dehydratase large subunit [Aestuariicella hydrocarbonica]NHO67235.1 3-isopropylmalate dehydratase large subunit [Aestuariicella hydrocarbonica]